jgi:hypothetical protein
MQELITRADILAEQLNVTVEQIHQTIEGCRLRTIGRTEDGYLVESEVADQIRKIYRNAATQVVQEPRRTPMGQRDWTVGDTIDAQAGGRQFEREHGGRSGW